jgi:predicted kinase
MVSTSTRINPANDPSCYDDKVKRLFLMCGIAFSGKTTVAKQLSQALGCAYVNLEEINAERGRYGGEGMAAEEGERTDAHAIARMKEWMAHSEDIVLDDTSCFRWLRDRYREFAHEDGYRAEVVYLDVHLQDVQARMVPNSLTASRRPIEAKIFAEHVRRFEAPQANEAAAVVRGSDMSRDGSNRNLRGSSEVRATPQARRLEAHSFS